MTERDRERQFLRDIAKALGKTVAMLEEEGRRSAERRKQEAKNPKMLLVPCGR